MWNLSFWLDWMDSSHWGLLVSNLHGEPETDVQCQACIFIWMLCIWTQVLTLVQQNFTRRTSLQPQVLWLQTEAHTNALLIWEREIESSSPHVFLCSPRHHCPCSQIKTFHSDVTGAASLPFLFYSAPSLDRFLGWKAAQLRLWNC